MKKFTKEEFIKMYNTYDSRKLAEICECSVTTLYKRLNELGIILRGRGTGQRKKRKLIIED